MCQVSGRRLLSEGQCRVVVLLPTTALLIICLSPMAFAQADTCSKPRVAVQLTEIHDGVFDLLNSKGVPQPRESWILQIQGKVLEELEMSTPGTEFVPVDGVGGALPTDCDYRFQYHMSIIGAGEDIEVAGLLHSEYTAYYMGSKLAQNNPCDGSDWLLDVEITKEDADVFQTIEHNIESWGAIGTKIEEYERSHPVPARGPTLHVSQNREYVSPLEEERSVDIKIDVTNCRGEPVYYVNPGQRVVLPKETERGEIKPTPGCFYQDFELTDSHVVLIIVKPEGASATYTLKNGMEPDIDTIEMTICGIDKKIVQETEIHIRGLELQVTPEKRRISPGEKTNIEIKFSRFDDKGNKEPLPGKQIDLEIRGLVDGHVRPSGDITTDDDGRAILEYAAGENDKRVTFSAEFHPKKYDEYVYDEGTVSVFLSSLRAIVHHTTTSTRDFNETKPEFYNSSKQSNSKEHGNIEIHLTCTKEPRIDYEFDKKSSKMKIRSYRYEIESARIQSASLEGQISTHDKQIDTAGIRHESRCRYSSSGRNFQLEPQSSRPTIEIRIDPSTGLINRVHLPSYKVTGTINHKSDCSGDKRKRVGNYEELVPYNQKDTRTSDLILGVGPSVDDRENCWNVADNKNATSLQGECSQIRKKTYLTEEETYRWEVFIRKNR
jgi:hypothetical protein